MFMTHLFPAPTPSIYILLHKHPLQKERRASPTAQMYTCSLTLRFYDTALSLCRFLEISIELGEGKKRYQIVSPWIFMRLRNFIFLSQFLFSSSDDSIYLICCANLVYKAQTRNSGPPHRRFYSCSRWSCCFTPRPPFLLTFTHSIDGTWEMEEEEQNWDSRSSSDGWGRKKGKIHTHTRYRYLEWNSIFQNGNEDIIEFTS